MQQNPGDCVPPFPLHPDDFAIQSVLRPGGYQLQDTPCIALDSPPPPTKEDGIAVPLLHKRRGFSIVSKELSVEPLAARPMPFSLSGLPTASGTLYKANGAPPWQQVLLDSRHLPWLVPGSTSAGSPCGGGRGTHDQLQPFWPISKEGRHRLSTPQEV